MTAYVEQLSRRDEIAELIEWHFKIVRVFLPNDQADGTPSRAGPIFGSHIHGTLLSDSDCAKVRAPRDRCRRSPRQSRALPKTAIQRGTVRSGSPPGDRSRGVCA